mgnify:CR=1 FL=1
MTVKPVFPDATPIDRLSANPFLDDVLAGLAKPQKELPAKYFYDAAGSELFEAITRLPEYYPTRTEIGILDGSGPEIAAATGMTHQSVRVNLHRGMARLRQALGLPTQPMETSHE